MDKSNNYCNQPDFELIRANLFNNKKQLNEIKFENNILFKSFIYNNMKFKNRFAFINLIDKELYQDDSKFSKYYLNIAKTGVGLIVTGCIDFKEVDVNNKNHIEFRKQQINEIHSLGTKIFFQIKPCYGRGIEANKWLNYFNYSASFNYSYTNSNQMCVRLSDSKCNHLINQMLSICKYSSNVGYDGVFINGDLFNIIGELSSNELNKRYFGYFSTYDDFSCKLIKSIVLENENINIIYSIPIDSFLKEIFGTQLKYIKTTAKIGTKKPFKILCEFLVKLVKLGVDGFVFKFGTYENEFLSVFNEFEREYLFYDYYKCIKEYFNEIKLKNKFGNDITIIYSDNINNLDKSGLYLSNQIFDFVDVTKQLFSNNDYLLNIKNNESNYKCLKCSYCNDYANKYGTLACVINPDIFGLNLLKSNILKNNNVAIIGAGLSGIVCANYLVKRGFIVDVFEKNLQINQTKRTEEIFDFCKLSKKFNDYIEDLFLKNAKNNQILLKTDTKFEISLINKNYRAIIVATGFHEKFLTISGAVLKSVVSIYDFLKEKSKFEHNDNYVILATSELSLKLSLFLLSQNKKVTVIIQNIEKLKSIPNDKYSYYFYELLTFKADIYVDAKIKKIETDFIDIVINKNFAKKNILSTIMNLKSNIKYKREPKLISIDYDLFIYEPEIYENNKVYYDIVSSGYTGEVYMIGNSLKICNDAEAIKSAYFVAKNL